MSKYWSCAALVAALALSGPVVAQETLAPVEEAEADAARQALEAQVEGLAAQLEDAKAALAALDEADAGVETSRAVSSADRIVNGIATARFSETGALLRGGDPATASAHCTFSLIGCRTILTAGHCVRDPDPAGYTAFLPHAGAFAIETITVHPDYPALAPAHDVAVLTLAEDVNGVTPVAVNAARAVPPGSGGTIAGYGRSGGFRQDYGLKRFGRVETAECRPRFAGGEFVCWDYANTGTAAPGTQSNTCNADSGGPFFAFVDGEVVVAGVTSGGTRQDCLAGDHAYDASVFNHLDFIREAAGDDLGARACGTLPQAEGAGARILSATTDMTGETGKRYRLNVPDGIQRMRVALNGNDDRRSDFDLTLDDPDGAEACAADGGGQFGFCEIDDPAPGAWSLSLGRDRGSGLAQLTVTLFDE